MRAGVAWRSIFGNRIMRANWSAGCKRPKGAPQGSSSMRRGIRQPPLLDALLALGLPVIEVHLSNIFRRETFRQHSLMSLAAKGVICGLGASGYLLAIDAFARLLRTEEEA